jgi:glycosyltransferase involved in cell wall biosynthesis
MLKILIVCSGYPPDIKGGGEKSTQILAQGLSARGHEVRVIAAADKDEERLDTDGKTHIKLVPSSNVYWNFSAGASLVRKLFWHALENYNPAAIHRVENEIHDFHPDVVVSSTIENFGPAIWQACNRLDIPVVHILRSYYIRCYKGTMFSSGRNCESLCIKCKCLTIGRRYATNHVNGVVGISQFILSQHATLFPNALTAVIPNAVKALDTPISHRRANSVVTFGYLGRIEPEKGIAEILEMFQQLPDDCHLIIAGSGKPGYESLLRQRYASERIRFLGWVDAGSVYSMIDFAVIPSLWNEPFGRVVIEAYSHGIPVIASARGGLSELVTNGRLGYLFDPSIPGDLRTACLSAAGTIASYDEMSALAKREALRYRPSEIVEQYETFFNQILARTDALQLSQ